MEFLWRIQDIIDELEILNAKIKWLLLWSGVVIALVSHCSRRDYTGEVGAGRCDADHVTL